MSESFSTLTFSLMGIGIVFTVLATIAGIIFLLQRLDQRWSQQEQQSREQRNDLANPSREPTIDTTTLVLISASVATVLQGRYYIKSIRKLPSTAARRGSWTVQGRAVQHGSHTVKTHHHR